MSSWFPAFGTHSSLSFIEKRRYPPLLLSLQWLLLLALSFWATAPRAELTVMVSIKPLELIALEVIGEEGRVDRLLDPSASPHDYPLRVSEMQRIQSADLVLWVGEELEAFLHGAVSQLPAQRRMAAIELDGLHWPSETEQAGSSHKANDHAGAHDHHHHDGRDPHLWLDPRNGATVALALAERLGELDPENSEGYQSRAEALAEELQTLDQKLAEQLEPVADRGFAVYHEGYSHFVQRYGLRQMGSVTVTPERRPGARHLYELRQQLSGAVCFFTEPYYDMGSSRSLAEELKLKLGELDLLGASESVERYPDLLNQLAQDVLACLAAE